MTLGKQASKQADWTGNSKSIYTCMGASNHSDKDREINDFYATQPDAINHLLSGGAQLSHHLWECACGQGHLSKRLIELGYDVFSTDLIDRGYGISGVDFLKCECSFDGDIITNPPYKYAQEFVEKALSLIYEGNKVFMFLKLQFLEGKARRALFDTKQLKTVYVFSARINCAHGGEFEKFKSSAVAYAWFEFQKGYGEQPSIKWIN